MRRWNGWGDDQFNLELPPEGRNFLGQRIGEATPLADAALEQVIARVPDSRLPSHPAVVTDAEDRVRHARGQSLPDWLLGPRTSFLRSPRSSGVRPTDE